VVVVEPGRRSVETAYQVRKLAADIGVKRLNFVGNKIRSEKDKTFLHEQMPGFQFLGFIPYKTNIIEADLGGRPPFEKDPETLVLVRGMVKNLKA
jgi:CO dehydrogenase maturation factor